MAGIEKICELTGEYPAWLMYGYKRDQLQIIPKARKKFANAGDTIYVQKTDLRWQYKWGGSSIYNKAEMEWFEPPFTDEKEFIRYKKQDQKLRLVQEYQFAFVTKLPELQGSVKGIYINWSSNISTVKRKMKRLLKCKKLNIIYVDDLRKHLENI